MDFQDSTLWKAAFGSGVELRHRKYSDELASALLRMRDQARMLVSEIPIDLRNFTVHDVTHLDALWVTASEIAGPRYELSPAEGFVLGGAILLHDAGMTAAAYPHGREQIKTLPGWSRALKHCAKSVQTPTEDEIEEAFRYFLRIEHASRAQHLALTEWKSPDGQTKMLLEDSSLRQKFGSFIGLVAASHWWDHNRLRDELDRIIPMPPPFPVDWKLDLLKVSSLLRVADAAHIDEARAPGFLWALRSSRLDRTSNDHWRFQNRLTQLARDGDAIRYESTSDFTRAETSAWWLAHDALQIINDELRKTDVLLADRRGENCRFAARRVRDCEDPIQLTRTITVAGWTPVDTTPKISDVPRLISALGGSALYGGDPSIPLREIVQNCCDAILYRAEADPSFELADGSIGVVLREENEIITLTISDNGIGMDRSILTGAMLDFGASGWSEDSRLSSLDHPERIGKFGIGFYSVFMIADCVEVVTRSFEQSVAQTLSLNFGNGLTDRAVLCDTPPSDRLYAGGTIVKLRLKNDSIQLFRSRPLRELLLHHFPLLKIDITVDDFGRRSTIPGLIWHTVDPLQLLKRVCNHESMSPSIQKFSQNLRNMYKDQCIAGRLAVFSDQDYYSYGVTGVVICKGVRVSEMRMLGVMEGKIVTAARDYAEPIWDTASLYDWASEQEQLVLDMGLAPEEQCSIANTLASLGYRARQIKICETRRGFLSLEEFEDLLKTRNDIIVMQDASLSLARRYGRASLELYDGVVAVEMGYRPVVNVDRSDTQNPKAQDMILTSEKILLEVIAENLNISADVMAAFDLPGDYAGPYARRWAVAKNSLGDEIKTSSHKYVRDMTLDILNLLVKNEDIVTRNND